MQELISEMTKLGYKADVSKIALDGKIHRMDAYGKNDGWVVGYQNSTRKGDLMIVAKFGSWKTREEHEYKSDVRVLSKEDKKAIEEDIKKAQKQLDIERQIRREEAAKDADRIWAAGSENPNSDYLKRKKINGLYGCKTSVGDKGRELLIPMRDSNNKLWGIQRIHPDGAKLFMEGQRKESTFHVLPFAEALEEVDCIYVSEGFATGASIFEAIKKPVVIAFDSGNIRSVVLSLKEKYKDKPIIICGDDDRFTTKPDGTLYNPGREAAENSAKEVLGKAIFPKFNIDNGKQTDFNDLMLSEGIEVVKNQILGVKPEHHAVHCLGYQDDTYYFISSEKPQVTAISKGSFSKLSLMDLMPIPYWETNYPTKDGVNWDSAMDSLMRGCRKKGRFIPKNVRGAGVWQDQGKTIVNIGNALYVDEEIKDYREFKSKYIYQTSEKSLVVTKEFASTKEMIDLANAFEKLSWKKTSSPKLLLGWLMISGVSGSLDWRPHLWITGASGTGKSFIMNKVVSKILKKRMNDFLGTSTEAGMRQGIGCDAIPVVFDELETDDDKSSDRVKSIIELCRQASSETDASVVKGTAHGKSISFSVRFSAIVSSIRPNLQFEQDKNRFTLLELERSEENNFLGEEGIEATFNKILNKEFIQKMYSRSINKIDLILGNKEVFYSVMHTRFKGRFSDQYGIMLSGYFAAIQDQVVSRDEASFILDKFIDLSEEAAETVSGGKDEYEFMNYILSSKIQTNSGWFKVKNLIEECINPIPVYGSMISTVEPIKNQMNKDLQVYGIRVIDADTIAIKTGDTEFKKLIKGTKWYPNPRATLKRIEGSEIDAHRILNKKSECVNIPLKNVL